MWRADYYCINQFAYTVFVLSGIELRALVFHDGLNVSQDFIPQQEALYMFWHNYNQKETNVSASDGCKEL